jgi:dienelactone hydrolase
MATRTSYVAFQAGPDLTVAGKLCTPMEGASAPAILICHGSDGVDGRGEFHAAALREAGFVTLEIDMWAARGTQRGAAARPRSPQETLADAFAALAFLRAQPEVDPERIAVMGFSWGGVVTLLSAVAANAGPRLNGAKGFAAHAAFYPVAWAYDRVPGLELTGLTGAPILIQTGEADSYDPPGAAQALAERLAARGEAPVRWVSHPGATHGFDRDLPAQTINDPFAHAGQGGPVLMEFNPTAASTARTEAVDFFKAALA